MPTPQEAKNMADWRAALSGRTNIRKLLAGANTVPRVDVASLPSLTPQTFQAPGGTSTQLMGALRSGQVTPDEFTMRSQQIAQGIGQGSGLPRPQLALGPGPAVAPSNLPATLPVRGALNAGASAIDDVVAQAANVSGISQAAVARGAAGAGGAGVPPTAGASGAAGASGGAAGAAGNLGRLGSLARPTVGTVLRGSGIATAGLIGSGIVDSINIGGENSVIDQGLTGAILGGGLGAGAAVALGATGPVGWGIIGASIAAGAAYKLFGGDKRSDEERMRDAITQSSKSFQTIAGSIGLRDDTIGDLMDEFTATTSILEQQKDREGLETFIAGFSQNLPQILMAAKQQQELEDEEIKRYNQQLIMQSQFAPLFEQQTQRASQAAEMANVAALDSAARLEQTSPQLAALIRQQGAQSNAAAQDLYAAYAKQLATTPVAHSIEDVQAGQAQYAQQDLLFQQMMNPVAG